MELPSPTGSWRIAWSPAPSGRGQANGRNPLPILIPCHRVIASNGTLGGYSGGVERKRYLLQREGVSVPEPKPRKPRRKRGGRPLI